MEYLLECTARNAVSLWEQQAVRFEAESDEKALERVNQLAREGKHPAELARIIKKW